MARPALARLGLWLGVAAWISVNASHARGDEPKALDVLTNAVEAMKASKSFAASVELEGIGGRVGVTPVASAAVVLRRDPQGTALWHFAARGKAAGGGGGGAGKPEADLAGGYDGTLVRALRPAEKKLIETDRGSISLLDEDGTNALVSWATRWNELAADTLEHAEDARLHLDATTLVHGVACHTLYIDYSGLEIADAPLMDAWWYLGVEDSLPRRVDLHYYDEERGDGFVRVSLRDLKRDAPVSDADLVIALPEGFQAEKRITPKPVARQRTGGGGGGGGATNPLGIGAPAADWTLKDSDGKDVSLKDFRGKVVLMDFWATWCPPCRAAMPGIQAIHEKYADKGVVVIGMNMSESGDAPGYMRKNKFTYKLVLNAEGVAPKYGVSGIPHFAVVAPDGTIAHAGVGFGEGTEEGLIAAIERLLDQPK